MSNSVSVVDLKYNIYKKNPWFLEFQLSSLFFLSVGILEVLHCVLVESPEALNIIKEGHIKSIISLLDKHGRNHKVSEL